MNESRKPAIIEIVPMFTARPVFLYYLRILENIFLLKWLSNTKSTV